MAELPSGWVETNLETLAEFVMGQAPPSSETNFEDQGVPFVKAGEFGVERPIIREWTTRPLKLAASSDVLICVVGATAGKINLGADCAIGRSVAAIRPHSSLLQKFLYQFLATRVLSLREGSVGSAQGVISKSDLGRLSIPLPPLAEQKRIVAKVDSLLARINRAREELARVPMLVERANAAALEAAFSGRLVDNFSTNLEIGILEIEDHVKIPVDRDNAFKLTRKKDLPSQWKVLRLGELGKIVGGGTPDRKQDHFWNGDIVWITPKDMKKTELNGSQETITLSGLEKSSAKLIPRNSVLFVVRGMILLRSFPVAINRTECAINQDMKALIPHDFMDAEFVAFALRHLEQDVLSLRGSATHGTKRLESSVIMNVAIPVPPLEEQIEIRNRLKRLLTKIHNTSYRAATSLEQLDSLEQQILAKAFRGELVPQDPGDEPASALLARVKAERESVKTTKPKRMPTATAKPANAKTRKPKTPRTDAMTKARTDDDVWHQPYLKSLLELEVLIDDIDLSAELGIDNSGPREPEEVAQALFKKSELEIADFYKQLAWEIEAGHIVEEDGRLRAA